VVLRKLVYLLNLAHEVPARKKLHDNVKVLVVFEDFKNARNMWMVSLFEDRELISHKVQIYGVLIKLCFPNNFDRSFNASLRIHGLVNATERP